MNILYCGDNNVEDGLLISVLSLLKNGPSQLNIYVLTADIETKGRTYHAISNSVIQSLEKLLKKQNTDNTIVKIDITQLVKQDFPVINLDTIFTPGCMLRLYADEVISLPDKVLYLDTDIICRKNFNDFYSQKMDQVELSGVLDYYGKWFFHHQLEKFDYINSGVLLLNLPKIRETKLFGRCRKLCQSKKMFMPNQSAINKFAQFKRIIPRRFNEQRKLHNDTVFQHFTTSFRFFPWIHTLTVKPWQVDRVHSELKLHEYYDILAEYQNIMPELRGI